MKIKISLSTSDAALLKEMFEKGEFGDLVEKLELSQPTGVAIADAWTVSVAAPRTRPSSIVVQCWKRLNRRRVLGGMSVACALAGVVPIWAPPAYAGGLCLSLACGLLALRSRAGYALPIVGALLNTAGLMAWPMAFGLFLTQEGYRFKYGDRIADPGTAGELHRNAPTEQPDAVAKTARLIVGVEPSLGALEFLKKMSLSREKPATGEAEMEKHFRRAFVSEEERRSRLETAERGIAWLKEMGMAPATNEYDIPPGRQHLVIKSGSKVIFSNEIDVPAGQVIACSLKKGPDNDVIVKFEPDIVVR